MVWGCVTAHGVGALHRIVGIMKKEMYQNILETEFQRSAQMLFPDGNYLFQQDNDPKHTAGVVQNYIRQSGIPLLDNWPAQSPDLNPIENLWAILDLKLQSRKPNTEAELFEQLQRTWQELDAGLLTRLADSMPSRIEKVIAAKGGHIDY